MISFEKYVAGWLDSSVHDLLEVLPPKSRSTTYALITCLDSNLEPGWLLDESADFKSLMAGTGARPVDGGLLLPTQKLLELDSCQRIFFGFDEVWFFPNDRIEPKPHSAGWSGPRESIKRNSMN
jgi:hypothetical protein